MADKPVTGAVSLADAPLKLGIMRDLYRRELIEVLNSVPGKKGLVIDPKCSGILGLVAEVPLLKHHGVENFYHLLAGRLDSPNNTLVYVVRPNMVNMKYIAEQIHLHQKENFKKQYAIFFVPRKTSICERVLEEEGVFGNITFGEIKLDLVPFETDVLSLEMENLYKECCLEDDKTGLYYIAQSIMRLQTVAGVIPNIKGKGANAKIVFDIMKRLRSEWMDTAYEEDLVEENPQIETLILIDRDVDMLTPMCTQLTYEGLIDETLGIKNSFVELKTEDKNQPKKQKVPLNSNDKLFAEIRDVNFGILGPMLNKKARFIDDNYKERHNAKTITDLKEFIKKLGGLQQEQQSLKIHTDIAELLMTATKTAAFLKRIETEQAILSGNDQTTEYIEDCVIKQEPFLKVLRMLVMLSIANNGLKPKQYDYFRREILQSYGYEHMFTLANLEKLGLFKSNDSGKNSFVELRKKLRLIEDVNDADPKDISYVYSGYAPLSVRIVQAAVQSKSGGWKGIEDTLKLLPGPIFEETQTKETLSATTGRPVVVVYFIGGVTYTEIAALRFLGLMEDCRKKFIIATTKIITGDSILDSVAEKTENPY